jgi:hypothetical protein
MATSQKYSTTTVDQRQSKTPTCPKGAQNVDGDHDLKGSKESTRDIASSGLNAILDFGSGWT